MSEEFTANGFLDREVGEGVQPVLALFESARLQGPNGDAVRKWRERNSMPALWLAKVLLALEIVEGRSVSMATYFKEGRRTCLSEKHSFSGLQPSVFD